VENRQDSTLLEALERTKASLSRLAKKQHSGRFLRIATKFKSPQFENTASIAELSLRGGAHS
jgi:hypothetical protein